MNKQYVVYHDSPYTSWWHYDIETASTADEASHGFFVKNPNRAVFWVEKWSEEFASHHPVYNPNFTEWAKERHAKHVALDESVYTVSASAEDKPVRKFKQPELPLEVYHTVEFDPIKAWAATKAASEGQ